MPAQWRRQSDKAVAAGTAGEPCQPGVDVSGELLEGDAERAGHGGPGSGRLRVEKFLGLVQEVPKPREADHRRGPLDRMKQPVGFARGIRVRGVSFDRLERRLDFRQRRRQFRGESTDCAVLEWHVHDRRSVPAWRVRRNPRTPGTCSGSSPGG